MKKRIKEMLKDREKLILESASYGVLDPRISKIDEEIEKEQLKCKHEYNKTHEDRFLECIHCGKIIRK